MEIKLWINLTVYKRCCIIESRVIVRIRDIKMIIALMET